MSGLLTLTDVIVETNRASVEVWIAEAREAELKMVRDNLARDAGIARGFVDGRSGCWAESLEMGGFVIVTITFSEDRTCHVTYEEIVGLIMCP